MHRAKGVRLRGAVRVVRNASTIYKRIWCSWQHGEEAREGKGAEEAQPTDKTLRRFNPCYPLQFSVDAAAMVTVIRCVRRGSSPQVGRFDSRQRKVQNHISQAEQSDGF